MLILSITYKRAVVRAAFDNLGDINAFQCGETKWQLELLVSHHWNHTPSNTNMPLC